MKNDESGHGSHTLGIYCEWAVGHCVNYPFSIMADSIVIWHIFIPARLQPNDSQSVIGHCSMKP